MATACSWLATGACPPAFPGRGSGWVPAARRIGPLVRHQMAVARGANAPAVARTDPAEQLRKLAELGDAGPQTEDEFQATRAATVDRL